MYFDQDIRNLYQGFKVEVKYIYLKTSQIARIQQLTDIH